MTNRIATSVRIVFAEERVVAGAVVVHALPSSAPLTPDAGACCKQPNGKCAAGFAKWDHLAWRALTFAIDDPHDYPYEFESSPDGFVARAVGDLDRDGELSKFEIRGKMAGEELVVEPIVVEDELE